MVRLLDREIAVIMSKIPIEKNIFEAVIISSIQNTFIKSQALTAIDTVMFGASNFSNAEKIPNRTVGIIKILANPT